MTNRQSQVQPEAIHERAATFKTFLGEQSYDILADYFTFEECFRIFQAYMEEGQLPGDPDLWGFTVEDFNLLTAKLPKRLAKKLVKRYGGGLIHRS